MTSWKNYELQIFENFKGFFPNCRVAHDVKVLGKFSKVYRQVDVAITAKIEGFNILGVIECKHFSRKIDVPIIDKFIGFLEDVDADFGYIITNVGFSVAAKNRAKIPNIHLQIMEYSNLDKYEYDIDNFINEKINSLSCLEPVFLIRQQQRSRLIDLEKTSFENREIWFKREFVRTEYFANKKLLEESARVFRDFACVEQIKIAIPMGEKVFWSQLEAREFERFLDIKFDDLRKDIKVWRLFLGKINKSQVREFAKNYVKNSPGV